MNETRLVGDLRTRQRFILGSSVWTIPGTIGAAMALDAILPHVAGPVDMAARLALAAQCSVLAALPVGAAIGVIAAKRLLSGAHNPLLQQEDPVLQIQVRVGKEDAEGRKKLAGYMLRAPICP